MASMKPSAFQKLQQRVLEALFPVEDQVLEMIVESLFSSQVFCQYLASQAKRCVTCMNEAEIEGKRTVDEQSPTYQLILIAVIPFKPAFPGRQQVNDILLGLNLHSTLRRR